MDLCRHISLLTVLECFFQTVYIKQKQKNTLKIENPLKKIHVESLVIES